MQIYPAALAIGSPGYEAVWDGLRLQTEANGSLVAKSNAGLIYLQLEPWTSVPRPDLGEQGALVHGVDDARGGEITVAVWKTSGCGCGGPKKQPLTDDLVAALASWEPDDALPV